SSPLVVRHLEGAPTSWTVRVSPLPVVLSAVTLDTAFARTGEIVTAGYTVSGDTTITAVVTDAGGVQVRTLATALPVDAGDHKLTWDARGAGGQGLPSGAYTVTISSTDPQGALGSAGQSLTLDNDPPDAELSTPAAIQPTQSAQVTVTDA